MTSTEFIELVRKMRAAQKDYYRFDVRKDHVEKQRLLVVSKQLEAQVDKADISDPQNLVTDAGLF